MAAAWVKAGLIGLLVIPALLIFPILAPVILFLAVAVFFKEQKRADEIVQQRREEIETELPVLSIPWSRSFVPPVMY